MDIVVIGLGSMGKRRIRLLQRLYPNYRIIGIDERRDRREEAVEIFGISCIDSLALIKAEKCCAFVCTGPLSHAEIIKECLNKGWHVFSELNLVKDGYEENIALANENHCMLFLSSPFLYREEQGFIHASVEKQARWNYIYHVGQYLPDWHPWENYEEFFVGNKRTSGCREILSVELPWLSQVFGEIVTANAVSDKLSNLHLNYNDNYMIQLAHKGGNKGVLVVDIVSPVAVRKFEAYTENAYLSWEGTPDSLKEYDVQKRQLYQVALSEKPEQMENYSSFIIENAYINEIRVFFESVLNERRPVYGFEEDMHIIDIIDSIGV